MSLDLGVSRNTMSLDLGVQYIWTKSSGLQTTVIWSWRRAKLKLINVSIGEVHCCCFFDQGDGSQ